MEQGEVGSLINSDSGKEQRVCVTHDLSGVDHENGSFCPQTFAKFNFPSGTAWR